MRVTSSDSDNPDTQGRSAALRVLLVDPEEESRTVMIQRLSAQGYAVDATGDPAMGADMALSAPPAVLVADLWMPSISGVQLCRLLGAEPATADVPVILRGQFDDPRSRFWAERAGAAAYVVKGRMAELVRALADAAKGSHCSGAFFMQLGGGSVDIRDRIARHLDAALFESVIASEVRALSAHDSFDRLFDNLAQFLSQVIRYRWLAVRTRDPEQFALHRHPLDEEADEDARAVLGVSEALPVIVVADEDARNERTQVPALSSPIGFSGVDLGAIAIAPGAEASEDTAELLGLVARELGGPLRIAALMEEAKRLATTDTLTGLMNRRAFLTGMRTEVARCARYGLPMSMLLLDIDHFKSINDTHGHAAGDRALAAVGGALRNFVRTLDLPARWGGEEMVVALTNTDLVGAGCAAERLRQSIAALEIRHAEVQLRVTVSIGVATLEHGESVDSLIDRADRAMYVAKASGRNRVASSPVSDTSLEDTPPLARVDTHASERRNSTV